MRGQDRDLLVDSNVQGKHDSVRTEFVDPPGDALGLSHRDAADDAACYAILEPVAYALALTDAATQLHVQRRLRADLANDALVRL